MIIITRIYIFVNIKCDNPRSTQISCIATILLHGIMYVLLGKGKWGKGEKEEEKKTEKSSRFLKAFHSIFHFELMLWTYNVMLSSFRSSSLPKLMVVIRWEDFYYK